MKHARDDYDTIQDTTAARRLALLVLSLAPMDGTQDPELQRLAHEVLGIPGHGQASVATPTPPHPTPPRIPEDEPVFLVRGQDAVGGATVRAWADLAEAQGSSRAILQMARAHADRMDAWPRKKTPDLPHAGG